MNTPLCPRLAACVLLLSGHAHAAGGFVELRAHTFVGVEGEQLLVTQRVRPELGVDVHERMRLSVTVEGTLSQGRSTEKEVGRILSRSSTPLPGSFALPRYENRKLRVSEADDYLSVERLLLDVYLPQADLRIGRQAVQWGSALLVNPTDPFPEVLLVDPWKQRRGVNAVRATVPVGSKHDLQAVVGSNDSFTALRLAARGTANVGLADISLVGAWREEVGSGIVGIDLRGTAIVGYWIEAAMNVDDNIDNATEEVAVGIDYSFPLLEQLLVRAQYYRHGAGSTHASLQDMTARLQHSAGVPARPGEASTVDPFAPVFQGRDYGLLMLSLVITPELTAAALMLQNLGDGSALMVPSVLWTPTGWLELAAAAQVTLCTWGSGGELRPRRGDLQMGALDFSGLVPTTTLIVWSRFSF